MTSAKPSAMPCSPPRSRLAIGAGRTLSSSSSFSRFLFSITTFFSRSSSTMPLKAEQSWPISSRVRTGTLGAVVAGGEAPHAGGELAQRPEQRARQPGGGQRPPPAAPGRPTIIRSRCEPVDRREGLGAVDLGDQRPLDAGNRERSPRGERRDAAVADDLAGTLDAGQRGPGGLGVDALMQHRRAVAANGGDLLVRRADRPSVRRSRRRDSRRTPAGRSARR